MAKITEIQISNYQGIEQLRVAPGASGVMFEGANGSGKSSALDGILAALTAKGIKAEHVKRGAARAEILIQVDGSMFVRRTIRAGGGTDIAVLPDDGLGAAGKLAAVLSPGAVDPLRFMLADEKGRERIILDALPVRVTADDLGRWIGPDAGFPKDDIDLSKHGLVVLRGLLKTFGDRRTIANREAKSKRVLADAFGAAEVAAATATGAHDDVTIEEAEASLAAARRAKAEFDGRRASFETAKQGAQTTREKIEDLRRRAAAMMPSVQAEALVGELMTAVANVRDGLARKRADLVAQLAAVDEQVRANDAEWATQSERQVAFSRARNDADDLTSRADSMQETLDSLSVLGADDDQIAAAAAAVTSAEKRLAGARACAAFKKARDEHESAEQAAARAAAYAAELDVVVKRLQDDAPGEVAARGSIPGFDFAAMTLDGVPIATTNSARLMRFCIELAKRTASDLKVIVADGLERLDEGALKTFIEIATEDGWQLIGSRVTAERDLTFHAIAE